MIPGINGERNFPTAALGGIKDPSAPGFSWRTGTAPGRERSRTSRPLSGQFQHPESTDIPNIHIPVGISAERLHPRFPSGFDPVDPSGNLTRSRSRSQGGRSCSQSYGMLGTQALGSLGSWGTSWKCMGGISEGRGVGMIPDPRSQIPDPPCPHSKSRPKKSPGFLLGIPSQPPSLPAPGEFLPRGMWDPSPSRAVFQGKGSRASLDETQEGSNPPHGSLLRCFYGNRVFPRFPGIRRPHG